MQHTFFPHRTTIYTAWLSTMPTACSFGSTWMRAKQVILNVPLAVLVYTHIVDFTCS